MVKTPKMYSSVTCNQIVDMVVRVTESEKFLTTINCCGLQIWDVTGDSKINGHSIIAYT